MKVRSEAAQTGMDARRIWRFSASATEGPADYEIVPPQEVKIARSKAYSTNAIYFLKAEA
jgi:hypothetical protein